ncbi:MULTISPECIES: tRNA1(Val) (adenine(37)-N6)-methyltransferase [unclassified Aureimonas]|uniref:tRNA1(Val) (adenine(37)-N6)-methyltransferase n=1 Tax=unclassified Aureimonas TaxID=2615206 RepID=UPI0006F2DC1C|nr:MULTISPECIES: methyltransferase [unclassified Aureimonas]KQT65132.1 hypothetical protein ASG62_22310 [Aureimonas sp. Leaf427]KQT76218.1 hypothetical protein ASG54_15865 [Aureimonas sp. Leaf460]
MRGAFHLLQPRTGFRAGLDALLLAACPPPESEGRAADLGSGSGVVGLAAAARCPGLAVTLVEKDPAMADLSRRSLMLEENAALAPRLSVAVADLLAGRAGREAAGLKDGAFGLILTNPPFHPAGGRASPDARRDAARAMPEAGFLQRWLASASALLAHGGTLFLVARPDNLPAILEAGEGRYGDIRIRPVQPSAGRRASRILVSARRGSKAPLSLLPPIVLAEEDGRPSDVATAIGEGRATVGFEI